MEEKQRKSPEPDILNFENNDLVNAEGAIVVLNQAQIQDLEKLIESGEFEMFTLPDNTRGYKYKDENGQEQIVLDKVLTVDAMDSSLLAAAEEDKANLTQSDCDEIEAALQADQDDKEKDPDWLPDSPMNEKPKEADPAPTIDNPDKVKKKLFRDADDKELDSLAGNIVSETTKDQTKWAVRKFKGENLVKYLLARLALITANIETREKLFSKNELV